MDQHLYHTGQFAELKHLISTGQDPASPAAQALVQQWQDLLHQFTHNDATILQGLRNMYNDINNAPA